MTSVGADDPRAQIAAWRDSGADRADPVRFRLIDALARRAAGHSGEARRLLDQRLSQLVHAYGEALAGAGSGGAHAGTADAPRQPAAGPLATLAHLLTGHPPADTAGPGAPAAAPRHAAQPDPALIDYFHRTWTRLSADRAWRQSLERVPENAGPLNSNHLVHRALSMMRELSPGYLQQFLSYADTLARLERLDPLSQLPRPERAERAERGSADSAASGKDAPRSGGAGKATRAKPRQPRTRAPMPPKG